MLRLVPIVSAVALACFLAGAVVLARIDRGGPAHMELHLPGGVPATLFLPGEGRGRDAFRDPVPEGSEPPAVVLMHGFAGDRFAMSGFARRLAGSGYAVLTIDAAGHGQSPHPYRRGSGQAGVFFEDLGAAVDFLRLHPAVDGSRVAVAGHSMGASSALDYAGRDSGVDAAVLLSGGFALVGPFRPANALFLVAEGDPPRIHERSRELAGRLAGVEAIEPGRTYGVPARRDAVRWLEVAGRNHQSIVWDREAVAATVRWLDATWGRERAGWEPPADPRAPVVVGLAVAFLLVLPGLGLVTGRLVPERPWSQATGRWSGLLWLAGGLVVTMPLLAGGSPFGWIPLEVGDAVAAQLGLAGLLLLGAIQLRRPELLRGLLERWPATLWGAGLALVAIFALLQPFAPWLHRVSLTPERARAALAMGLGLLPFALAFNLLVRRGAVGGATGAVLAGRAVLLLVLGLGISAGVLPRVVSFMLPPLALLALFYEVLAVTLYAASRNLLAVALVDAAWLALITAAIMPIRG